MTCTPHIWDTLWIFDLASIHLARMIIIPIPIFFMFLNLCLTIHLVRSSLLVISSVTWSLAYGMTIEIVQTLFAQSIWLWFGGFGQIFVVIFFLCSLCVYQKLIKMLAHQINEFDFLCDQPNAYSTCETCYRSKGLWIILINDWRQFLLLFTLKFFLISTFWWIFIVLSISLSLCFTFMFKNNLNILSYFEFFVMLLCIDKEINKFVTPTNVNMYDLD